jgi:hypothetical protein
VTSRVFIHNQGSPDPGAGGSRTVIHAPVGGAAPVAPAPVAPAPVALLSQEPLKRIRELAQELNVLSAQLWAFPPDAAPVVQAASKAEEPPFQWIANIMDRLTAAETAIARFERELDDLGHAFGQLRASLGDSPATVAEPAVHKDEP